MSTAPVDVPPRGETVVATSSRTPVGLQPSRTSTMLTRALVRETSRHPRGVRRKALSAMRKLRLRLGDPPVVSVIDGSPLVLPLSHDLPVHCASHPDYSRNLGRVVAALHAHHPDATVVDIGANVGDSVAIIRAASPDAQILCIEGDEEFLPYLHDNVRNLTGVEIAPVYVRHLTDDASRAMAVIRSGGTASLVERVAAGDPVSTQPLETILDEHPRFATPGLLKLDTDGHDADILLRAESVLCAGTPVVFFEFDPAMAHQVGGTDPYEALELLERLGYRRALVFANTGRLVAALEGRGWADALPELATDIGPGREVAYFDLCVFSATHDDIAIELERQEDCAIAAQAQRPGEPGSPIPW